MDRVDSRLDRQVGFLLELGKLCSVVRRTYVPDGSRCETSAEHSWLLTLYTVVLAEHSGAEGVDLARAVSMAALHDVVEIDAGDTYAYGASGHEDKAEREARAAQRIFGLLPADQAARFQALWREFEEGETPEARLAVAVDRLQPLVHNLATGGKSWLEHGVTEGQVRRRIEPLAAAAPALYRYASELVARAVAEGLLRPA